MSEHLARRQLSHTYHRPSAAVQGVMERVRESYIALVTMLDGAIPECREKSLSFTALEEASMWAIKALALTDPDAQVGSSAGMTPPEVTP